MDEFVFQSFTPNLFNKVLRISCILVGTALVAVYPYFEPGFNISTLSIKLFGMALVVLAVADPLSIFWKDLSLKITDKFIRITDEMSLQRTAYWKKLNKISLSRFNMRLFYSSGAGEQFRLPFIKKDTFKELRETIRNKAEQHQIEVQEKSWWEN